MLSQIAIPFKIEEVFQGLAETTGILRYAEDFILVEFQTKDSIFGVIQSDVKCIKIPLESLLLIELKKKMFSTRIIIKTNSLHTLKKLKGYNKPELILDIKKEYRDEAQQFISHINLLKAENLLKNVEGER